MMLGLGLALGSARVQTLLASASSVLDQLHLFKPGALYTDDTGGDLVDTPSNANLVENGGFDENIDSWSEFNSTATWVDGAISILNGGFVSGAYRTFSTVVGRRYKATARLVSSSSFSSNTRLRCGEGSTPDAGIADSDTISGPSIVSVEFVATSATSYVYMRNDAGTTHVWDDVSVVDAGGESIGAILDQASMAGQSPQAWLDANGITDISTLTTSATQSVLADRPTYIKDGNTHLARFNGSNQELQIPNIGQTYVCMAVRSTDTRGVIIYGNGSSSEFVLVAVQGDPTIKLYKEAGSPTVYIDGSVFVGTWGQTYTTICDGEWHIIEIIDADFSIWGPTLNIGAFGGYELFGDIACVTCKIATPTDAERQIIRNAAQAAAEGRL